MKKVALLDICLPDYFTGYHKPVLSIPLSGTMTNMEIADELESEFNAIYDYINPDEDKAIDKLYDDYFAELRLNPDVIFYQSEDEQSNDEDDIFNESAYAYFSIINPVYNNGIMFLDK